LKNIKKESITSPLYPEALPLKKEEIKDLQNNIEYILEFKFD
jgi:hypothetical protein